MRSYTEYWVATMIRGLLAILAATGILFFPEMATTLLLLPFGILISISAWQPMGPSTAPSC
jgi:uncharacterized membrane protein HdeD (DUF308 family)